MNGPEKLQYKRNQILKKMQTVMWFGILGGPAVLLILCVYSWYVTDSLFVGLMLGGLCLCVLWAMALKQKLELVAFSSKLPKKNDDYLIEYTDEIQGYVRLDADGIFLERPLIEWNWQKLDRVEFDSHKCVLVAHWSYNNKKGFKNREKFVLSIPPENFADLVTKLLELLPPSLLQKS